MLVVAGNRWLDSQGKQVLQPQRDELQHKFLAIIGG